ncbi:MAG TPA: peptide chain release factor N(5)-glutamine methyltransferase [Cyanobacteria bacterium UBA8156]|jgi:release factor glutamine methyltransferase|nr:peptide chain release factor N(5)-glutamine methyltransferase [Cyanobacteria bacterium UBA8156]
MGAFANWYRQARQEAIAAGIATAELDWLMVHELQVTKLALRLGEVEPTAAALTQLQTLWAQRRDRRTPVQYLVGFTPWRDLRLQVTPAVLIPRPETELLIDICQSLLQPPPGAPLADLGTGSGAIALSLARTFPHHPIHAVDLSAAALTVARHNATLNGLGDRLVWHQGSWLAPLGPWAGQFAAIVANPPYIPTAEITALAPEVRDWEPRLALDGGPTGLDCLQHLSATAPRYLRPGGFWAVEVMAGQGAIVAQQLAATERYRDIQVHPDDNGIDRFVTAYSSCPVN